MRTTITFVVLAALAACHGSASEPVDYDEGGAASPTDWSTLTYATVAPAPPHWTDEIPARVTFDEKQTSRIGTPLGGRVTAVLVELGQRVKAGTALFNVTSGDLSDLRSSAAKAAVDLGAAQQNYDRVKSLVDAGSLPKKQLVAADQDLQEAKLSLAVAQQKLSSLKVGARGNAGFTITAPRDGVVVEKTVAVGQQVSPDNGSLLAVADLSDVWIVADVLEDEVGAMKVGGKAKVAIDGIDAPIAGAITQISSVIDPDRHTLPVRIALANTDGRLRPNSLAQIQFYDEGAGALSIPSAAVISDGATNYVYLLHNGKLVRREVVAGPPSGGTRSVRSGLAAGDQIVASGNQLLENQIQIDDDGSAGSHLSAAGSAGSAGANQP